MIWGSVDAKSNGQIIDGFSDVRAQRRMPAGSVGHGSKPDGSGGVSGRSGGMVQPVGKTAPF
jgi:hypothetical protein